MLTIYKMPFFWVSCVHALWWALGATTVIPAGALGRCDVLK